MNQEAIFFNDNRSGEGGSIAQGPCEKQSGNVRSSELSGKRQELEATPPGSNFQLCQRLVGEMVNLPTLNFFIRGWGISASWGCGEDNRIIGAL